MVEVSDPLELTWLGRIGYQPAWELQRRLGEAVRERGKPGVVLLLEHDHVFTLGRSANPENLLWDEAERRRRQVDLIWSDRGGDATYHGPGQLVGYPLLDLSRLGLDILGYLRALEESLVRYLLSLGIEAVAGDRDHIGVWVGDEKVAAIGINARQGLTSHGFALNLDTDLEYFQGIVPCGLADRGATSVERLGGGRIGVAEAARAYAPYLAQGLCREAVWRPVKRLTDELALSVPGLGGVQT